MDIKGFKGRDGTVHKYDYEALANKPEIPDAPGSGGNADYVGVEPAYDDIPRVFLNGSELGNMTNAKNEVNMEMEYISKTERFKAAIKIKYQGSSSLQYRKKNFTIKMYADDSYEDKLKKNFKDWNHSGNKYVLKANYIDHSHARNIVSARLWDEIVSSRPDYDSLPEEMRNSPRNGAIDGFPVKLYVNGTYQGLYTWNIGKDDWMWGMDEDNANHVLLCGETNTNNAYKETPCNFRALWNGKDGTDWSIEVGTNSDALKTSLNNLIQFVMDNNGEDFRNGIGSYLDIQSAIDYYIFQYEICGYDGLAKNLLLATYDGAKWICGAYDMDSTYGLAITGGGYHSPSFACPENYQEKHSLLWERIEANYADELKARQAELRRTVLSYPNMVTHFERFMDVIGIDLYAEDLTIYADIPSGSTNNIKQIRNYIRDRQVYVDAEFAKMENFVSIPCTGISLSASELTFTAEGTQTIIATVTPEGCTDSIIWESDNTAIVDVSGGVVTAKANGSAIITVRCGNYSATCTVSVSGIAEPVMCTGISLDKTELVFTASGSQTLTATVTPNDCTEEVTWESSAADVATVFDGVVTAVADGDAVITARCGSYSAVCNVSVVIESNREIITLTEKTTTLPTTKGYKLGDTTGELEANADIYVTEGYIRVTENVSYTVEATSGQYLRVFGYDSTFTHDRNKGHNIVYGSDVAKTATFTVPSGVKYIRCHVYRNPGTLTITVNE